MDTEAIRAAVHAAIAAVAPECDVRGIRPGLPLRDQVDLDSLDWINLMADLQERLGLDIADAEPARPVSVDSIVSCIAARQAGRPAAQAVDGADAPAAATTALPVGPRRLADGTVVTLRPMAAADAALEAEFVRHLSSESRYKRFMESLRELPPATLKYLTDVDNVRHVALVACVPRDGAEVLLGVARYVVDAGGESCEFAIAVDDAWHGSGLAGLLMDALIDTARRRGLRRMEGVILPANRKMTKFARQLGFTLRREPSDPTTLRAVRPL